MEKIVVEDFETLLKLVEETLDDSCGKTAGWTFFSFIKFLLTIYRMRKKESQIFDRWIYIFEKSIWKLTKKKEKFVDANIREFRKRSY